MREIVQCLPAQARQQYIRLRNQKDKKSRDEYEEKRREIRGRHAAAGGVRSGQQVLEEWNCGAEFLKNLAHAWFEAALEACDLYDIPLDDDLCKCISDNIRGFVGIQFGYLLKNHAQGVPNARGQLQGQGERAQWSILNNIDLELEKARVANQKRFRDRVPGATVPTAIQRGKMRHTAIVINALISSPSDVSEERDAVTRAIYAWNAANRATTGILLDPIKWETHSFPASGDRPQAIINRQIVDAGDFLIGIFGNRLGTPTGEAQSGTIEEIERFRKAGKYVALYFSTADVPRDADREQLKALEEYQGERKKDTLYATFKASDELQRLVTQHLPKIVAEVHEGIKRRGELDGVAEDVQHIAGESSQLLTQAVHEPVKFEVEVVGEYPDGPGLHVTANRNVTATRLDYLDERDARLASEKLSIAGMDFTVLLDHAKLTTISNMKPHKYGESIPIGFRLALMDGPETIERKLPAALVPSFKPIGGVTTGFLKVLG